MTEQQTQVFSPVAPEATAGAAAEVAPVAQNAGPDPAPQAKLKLKAPGFVGKMGPSAGVWAGLAIAALGFGLIFFSWIKVASLLDVGLQMPYVVSGAMTGLGLVIVGIAVVDMAVRRQDRLERRHQMSLMRTLLEELREVSQPVTKDGQ